ncbi:hypothetical protein [Streptomyces sp. NBC_01618]|nr:hypothetical protein OH735_02885 [Streptomyces sp. NBC_01618]
MTLSASSLLPVNITLGMLLAVAAEVAFWFGHTRPQPNHSR